MKLEWEIVHYTQRDIMTIVQIFFAMGQAGQYMNNCPTNEKSNDNISWIVYSGNNASKAGNETKKKKNKSNTRFIE